jgi:three-Cys-motif partner protein
MAPPADMLWNSEPRTLLKHQVYRQYLHCWMAKICHSFPRSAIVDAFAGPGGYRDGPDGSPVVIAKTFLEHSRLQRFNQLRLLCQEKRLDRRDELASRLASLPKVHRLDIQVSQAGELRDRFKALRSAAHEDDEKTPVLWILDPFDYSSAPFSLVRACLASPRDEVLITWFADEIYRFCGDPSKEQAIDRHFGTQDWHQARHVAGEAHRKEALLETYQQSLQSLPQVHTGAFSIAGKNETARYSLVFATHSDAGMKCFNSTKWRMDPSRGHHVSEKRNIGQADLFGDTPFTSKLRSWLETQAGTSASFEDLARHAGRLGFQEKHLRAEMSNLAEDGLAVREHPLEHTRTPWPTECRVRFYAAPGGAGELPTAEGE